MKFVRVRESRLPVSLRIRASLLRRVENELASRQLLAFGGMIARIPTKTDLFEEAVEFWLSILPTKKDRHSQANGAS